MKKSIFIISTFLVAFSLQFCTEEEAHADGHIHGTVEYHYVDQDNVEQHEEIANAVVEIWLNESSANGPADFSTTTDTFGLFEFEELVAGVYFIMASGTDQDNVSRSGSALTEISEAVHEVEVEIEVE